MEQEFKLIEFQQMLSEVDDVSVLKEQLVNAFRIIMVKDNVIKDYMKRDLMP